MQTEEQKQDWLNSRLKIVGASEIATVIKSECTKEEIKQAMGGSADEFMKDKLFTSPFCLYNYKKQTAEREPFPISLSEHGHEMEKFVEMFINVNCGDYLEATCQPQELIKCPELHKLAGYTPDIFIKLKKDYEFNSETLIKRLGNPIFAKADEKLVCEAKTTNLYKFNKDNYGVMEGQEEVMFKYIIQNQYQTLIQNKIDDSYKYAIIGCAVPYHEYFDNDFFKGKAVELCKNLTKENFETLCGWYEVKLWIYPIFKNLQSLFIDCLNKWDERLQNCIEPKSDTENNKDICVQKDRLKKRFDEIKVIAQRDLGADLKGIIKMTPELQEKYPNLSDNLKIDKSNREDLLSSKKAIEKTKAEYTNICLENNFLGLDFETFTVHLSKSKRGAITFRNNFKTSSETLKGKVKVKNEIKPEIGRQNFM